ncbi:hypothetical protein GPDM_04574 [Planococcus donghaensis MPA1U2]|uniref:Uncharacterized protein n=1 Tax=Planococcus donghaensis MPA1U2 TaxID=933115 RepID=E7REM5_9BACL|nr:hypothetical protein [Planococcus donghaensis]EGA90606.1 hypothetical protein GPDM_04574 [Planococcus donghaensis MPA1U2]
MTLSKKTSSSNALENNGCKYPVLSIGQNFTIDYGKQQSLYGKWQVVENEKAPFYLCSRILENGQVSKRRSADHRRQFFEAEIYYALTKKE